MNELVEGRSAAGGAVLDLPALPLEELVVFDEPVFDDARFVDELSLLIPDEASPDDWPGDDRRGDGLPGVGVLVAERGPDAVARWAASAPAGEAVLTPFGALDPELLSQDGCLDALVGLERLGSWVAAQQARLLARLAARPEPIVPAAAGADADRDADRAPVAPRVRGRGLDPVEAAELSMQHEVAAALRWSLGATWQRLRTAVALSTRLPDTLAALQDGAISLAHARTLAEATSHLDETVTAQVQARVLARAGAQTPPQFRIAVRRAVAALDPAGEAEQHQAAAAERRVAYEPVEHAMSWINAYLPAPDAQTVCTAVHTVADLLARADRESGLCRTPDQRRADALALIGAAVLRNLTVPQLLGTGSDLPSWQGRRPQIQVTVALSTLLALDAQPGELAGYGPIPADLARRIAADPTGTWHRLVTDPTGHLLDYGRTRYRPPQDLIDHITARDVSCRGTGCTRTARRCHLDHITDWATGGTTSPDNLHPLCGGDHHLKHDAGWQVTRLPDGTTRWRSPSGRTYDTPPTTLPIDTTVQSAEPLEPDDDPPPF